MTFKEEIIEEINYNHISHSHCWNQKQPPACGQKIEEHKQCCLCDVPTTPVDKKEVG